LITNIFRFSYRKEFASRTKACRNFSHKIIVQTVEKVYYFRYIIDDSILDMVFISEQKVIAFSHFRSLLWQLVRDNFRNNDVSVFNSFVSQATLDRPFLKSYDDLVRFICFWDFVQPSNLSLSGFRVRRFDIICKVHSKIKKNTTCCFRLVK
jgi:hypothetical protein